MSKRRKLRILSVLTPILTIAVIALCLIIGMLFYKQYKESKEIKYEYVSMTEEAAARAYVWLNDIENNELSYDEIKDCMGQFNLELVLTPSKTKGEYDRAIAENAYEYCVSQAEEGLEKAYKKAVINRLIAADYELDHNSIPTDETVESLMKDTFGISVSEYLKKMNVKLLPSNDELNSMFTGVVKDEK